MSVIMLNVIMLSVIKLNVIILDVIMLSLIKMNVILSVIMLNVIMLNVIMLSVIMLNVIMLSVAAPHPNNDAKKFVSSYLWIAMRDSFEEREIFEWDKCAFEFKFKWAKKNLSQTWPD